MSFFDTEPQPSPLSSRLWRICHSAWLLPVVFGFGLFCFIGFLYCAIRVRSRKWWTAATIASGCTLVLWVIMFSADEVNGQTQISDAAAIYFVLVWAGSITAGFALNRHYLRWRALRTPADAWYNQTTSQAGWAQSASPVTHYALGQAATEYGFPAIASQPQTARHLWTAGRGQTNGARFLSAKGEDRDENGQRDTARVLERLQVSETEHVHLDPMSVSAQAGTFERPSAITAKGGGAGTEPPNAYQVPDSATTAVETEPSWWHTDAAPPTAPSSPVVETPEPKLSMFDTAAHRSARPLPDQVVASRVFAAQRKLAGRIVVADEQIRSLLSALLTDHELTTPQVATAMGVPPGSVNGALMQVKRVLDVEGYEVVQVRDGVVKLDVAALKEQFGVSG